MSFVCVLHILRYCADLIASNKRRKKTVSRNKPIYYGVIRLKRNKGKISAFCVHHCILLGVDGCNRLGGFYVPLSVACLVLVWLFSASCFVILWHDCNQIRT